MGGSVGPERPWLAGRRRSFHCPSLQVWDRGMAQKQINPRGSGLGSQGANEPLSPIQRPDPQGAQGKGAAGPRQVSLPPPHSGQHAGQHPGQGPQSGKEQTRREPPQGGAYPPGAVARASGNPNAPQRRPAPPAAARAYPAPNHVAANDDMPSIGSLIYALQQRPSKSPFIMAIVASVVWFALGCLMAWSVVEKNTTEITGVADIFSTPSIVAVIATVVVPIALFWFLAVLVWRAQELRLMSSAMTEVAVRLAEPDKMAEQSVASLGQTVRRQVAAMNDAISRALGRAGELEALVHNEVAALERSYTENEHRVRNLISELASEREALANNSERVGEALRGVGAQITREIASASEKASASLTQATGSLADTLANRGHKITAAVTAAGSAIDEKLAERGTRITEQLVKHGAHAAETLRQTSLEVTRAIQETSDRSAAAISAKSNALVSSVMTMSERVGRETPVLLDRLGGEQTRLSGIIEHATQNLSQLEGALSQRTETLSVSIAERTKMLQTVLVEQSRIMDETMAERIQGLETVLSRRAQHMDTTFSQRAQLLDAALAERAQVMETSLTERAQALEATLSRQTGAIRDTLENHARTTEKNLSRQAQSIEQVVSSNSASIQRAVEELAQRSGQGSEALTNQAQIIKDVSGHFLGQVHTLTKRFEEQGSSIMNAARSLEVSNNKVDTIMETRQAQLGNLLEGINTRASELDRMMNNYSRMLEHSLTQAESRARKVAESLTRDSAEKSQVAAQELERLRADAQAHTTRAVTELKASFSVLAEQVQQQLKGLSTRVTESSRQVKDSAQQATVELEFAQSELRRQAKSIPEASRQSASAMRKALQDQLAALESLSDLASRHSGGGMVSRAAEPRQISEVREGPIRETITRATITRETLAREKLARENVARQAHVAPSQAETYSMPSQPAARSADFAREPYAEPASYGGPQEATYGASWRPSAEPDMSGMNASGMNSAPMNSAPMASAPYENEPAPTAPAPRQATSMQAAPMMDANQERRGGQWSLGDLLARASEPDDEVFGSPDQGYGASGGAESLDSHRQSAEGKSSPEGGGSMFFDMKDIAAAIDQNMVAEVWQRYNRGDQNFISRDLYTRQGQSTFDQVKRRYEGDGTFSTIVERYLSDFERLLKDASKADPKGRTVQNHLMSETGRIYLLLAHASGRMG
jgi:hypothetical protein